MTKLLDKQLDSSQPHRRELWQQFKKLPDEIVKAFNLDLDNFLDFTT